METLPSSSGPGMNRSIDLLKKLNHYLDK
jgi:hypothetical protein